MNKKEKKAIIELVLIIAFIVFAIAGLKLWSLQKRIASERYLLEVRYERQSVALGMGMSKEFVGINEYSEDNFITLRYYLAAYEEAVGSDDVPTIEDVKRYLSDKYDENGILAIQTRSNDINKYIDWFWNGGEAYADYYTDWVRDYRKDHSDKYGDLGKYDMTEEQAMSLLEDFKNCSDKLDYKEKYREKYNYEYFEITSRDYFLGEG